MTAGNDSGRANPSYKGYAYQRLVTIWVALKLMFGQDATASEVIVEPASHDDVKANLNVPEEDADGELTIDAGDELHIQIKFKGAGYWSSQNFADVVNDKAKTGARGPAPRARATSLLLQHPGRRYVFITNTSVDGALAKGRVTSPGERSSSSFLPTNLNLKAKEAAALKGRFAIIEQATPTEMRLQIDEILKSELNVPEQNLEVCVEKLDRMVEDRFLEVPDPLRKSDIERIAKSYGGLPHPDPRLAHYVPPANRGEANRLLQEKGAALLVGPSGYGKSLTAESIADERRRAETPFKIVRETDGLAAIEEAFRTPGRVLFHLEDPWGQSGLDKDQAAGWTKLLGNLFRDASGEKQFVVTSRSEIFRDALGEGPAPIWADRTIQIGDASYDQDARRAILHGNLDTAESWRQDLARQHEKHLLRQLRSPFEIDGFTRELRAVPKPADFDLDILVDRAQSNGRKHVVMDHVRGFGDGGVKGAAVLWALLRSSRPLSADRLIALRRSVVRLSNESVALDDLADHLSQTQLERNADGAFLAHSKVSEALEALARLHPRAAERALNLAARATCSLAVDDDSWVDELQRLFDGAEQLADKGVMLDAEVIQNLDEILIAALQTSAHRPRRFTSAWYAAQRRLSSQTPLGRLVHELSRGAPRKNKGMASISWLAPATSAADRAAVLAADPDLQIAKGFVSHILPITNEDYSADELLPWLQAFGVDLTPAFLSAGASVSRATDYVTNADTISEGALAWPDPPCDEVWKQIERMDDAVNAALERSAEERRQAWQGELDFAHQLAIQERAEDESPSAAHFARGYLRARRQHAGFSWIPDHPRPDLLLPIWAEVMRFDKSPPTKAEIDAFFDAVGDNDHLQADGLRIIGERRLQFARDRIEMALRTGRGHASSAAVSSLGWLEGDASGNGGKASAETILLGLLADLPAARAAALAPAIVNLEFGTKKKALAGRVVAASGGAQSAVQIALANSLGVNDETIIQVFRQLPEGDAEALIADGPGPLTRRLLMVAAAEGMDVFSTAQAWAADEDEDYARAALSALSFLGSEPAHAAIEKELKHKHFEVRRHAIQVLAPVATGARRELVLEMVNDKSAPVRASLANCIGEHDWTDGIPALLVMLGDTRNYARHPEWQQKDEPEYHVARAAADALEKFEPLSSETIEHIIAVLDGLPADPVDVELHAKLQGLLVQPEEDRIWRTLELGLRDDHVIGESGENLYPIRYSAAWSIVHRLGTHPTQIEFVPWQALATAAQHADPQLAAPALLALGCKLSLDADALVLDALRSEHMTPARVALALSMIDAPARVRSLVEVHGLLPTDHPLLDRTDEISADATDFERWPLSTKGRAWLEQLSGGDDIEQVLLWMMSKRSGLKLVSDEFDPETLRRQESIPLTTAAELFGME